MNRRLASRQNRIIANKIIIGLVILSIAYIALNKLLGVKPQVIFLMLKVLDMRQ